MDSLRPSLADPREFRFGPFAASVREGELRKHGIRLKLQEKPLQILLTLLERPGELVTREELRARLWTSSTFVEFEHNLDIAVNKLRLALGDSAESPRYVETIRGKGYRLMGSVMVTNGHRVETPVREAGAVTPEPAEVSVGRREPVASARRWVFGTALAAVLIVAPIAVVRSGLFPIHPKLPRTLAVLPFRNLSPDAESQFLSYSLADAIINRLGFVSEIVVRPSSYVAKYGDGNPDPGVVAKELHVEAVLVGNYIKEGDRLRVSAELVDVAKPEVLWRDTLDVTYDQLLKVQDRVAESVARGLQLRIQPQESRRLKKSVPKDALAYEYFLRVQPRGLPNDYRLTVQMLEKSVHLDSEYAPAWMDLGNAYAGYANWQGGGPEFRGKSEAAFDKALQLDPELPFLHTYMAIQMLERGQLDQGVEALREELRLNPNEALAHWWLMEAYLYGGMLDESIAEGESALRLDPLVSVGSTFNTYLHAGDLEKFLSTMPVGESARTSFYRGLCFFYRKDFSRAASEFELAFKLDPTLLHAKYGQALLFAIRQRPAEGIHYLDDVNQKTPTVDGEMLYKIGQIYSVLGDKSSGYRFLREAIDHNFYCHVCLAHDPLLASLHGEAPYAELLDLARERQQSFKRKYFSDSFPWH
jgi:DNA-binding winged helix-turn-helix (wHTH) protein/TolB-like protein/Tfp pilus assembly protein PilF